MVDFVNSLDDLSELDNYHVTLLAFLQSNKLLPEIHYCAKCNLQCGINLERRKFIFRCKCGYKCSLNKGTWFHNATLTYTQALKVIFCFVHSIRIKSASSLLSLSEKTLVDWYNLCREICIESNLASENRPVLGGEKKVVELGESKLGPRKYQRGKTVEGQWVFGIVELDSQNSFFLPVEKCDQNTLCSIIRQYIKPGTIILTDYWKVYNNLKGDNFRQLKASHSITFKAPVSHSKDIETRWWFMKRNLNESNRPKVCFEANLASYIWRKRHANMKPFERFLKDVAQVFEIEVSHRLKTI